MFCFNLRNKQYCIGNKQYSKVDYEEQIKKWNLTTHTGYNDAKKIFAKMMREIAWHRATFINKSENATGNYMENVQDMDDCFFLSHECEGCINTARGGVNVLHALDSLNIMSSQEVFYSM